MLGTEIPDGLLFGVAPVILLLVIGLMTWMVKELSRISTNNVRMEGRMTNVEEDVKDIKGYLGWPGHQSASSPKV